MSKYIPTSDLEQLSIQQLTFHLIQKGQEKVIFIDDVQLGEAQLDFFETLIHLSVSKSSEYSFLEEESEAVLLMVELLDDAENTFPEQTRRLSEIFYEQHNHSSSDGVLVFALLTVGEAATPMLYIAKLDYMTVFSVGKEMSIEGQQKAVLQAVQNAIVESENAIQKSALIDIDAHYDWDVLAQDRQKSGAGIADYFKSFLSVQEKEINAILSTKVVTEVQKWADKNSDEVLLPAEHVADYKERAVSYLRASTEFDTHELMDSVLQADDNPERKQDLSQSLYEHLEKSNLTDRTFAPDPHGMSASVTKNKIRTKEGVLIVWDGDAESHGVHIEEVDGKIQITIETDNYTYK